MEGKMKLKVGQKAAFGFGAFGKDVVYMLIATFLLNYYNVVLGMNAAFIGIVMMGARVFDAFNDPIMGIVVAKTKTKFGRFRPWILAGTVLNALTIFALFAVPANDDPNATSMKLWLAIFYVLWGVTYTLMDIPFWSMIPAVTEPGADREGLTSLARTCSGIGDAIPTVLTNTLVPIFSGIIIGHQLEAGNYSEWKSGFLVWAIIIAVVFVISELCMVLRVPEPKIDMEMKAPSVGQMFKALFTNDQAMVVVASIICVYTSLNICGNLVLYFFQFDVGNPDGYGVFTAVAFGFQVLSMMIIPLLRKKFSKNTLYLAGFIFQIIGFLVILLMAYLNIYTPENWGILCVPGALIYVGYGMLNVIMTIFLSDSVDYGEIKNGTREESVIFSMQTFTVKLASGIAVALAGGVIEWIGLNTADGAVQSAATLNGLRLWMTIPPIVLLVIGVILYKALYRLDEKKMDEIKNQLGKKQKEKE